MFYDVKNQEGIKKYLRKSDHSSFFLQCLKLYQLLLRLYTQSVFHFLHEINRCHLVLLLLTSFFSFLEFFDEVNNLIMQVKFKFHETSEIKYKFNK